MIVQDIKGYIEGQDILQIPPGYLTYPSKNVITYKGKVVSRLGIKNDGTAHTSNSKIHSEYVWKKAPGGAKSLRVFGTTIQVKLKNTWITLYTGLSADTTRLRFTSWIDTNGSIIKNRLFMVDGSENIYEWNGGVANIAAVVGGDATTLVRISDTDTLLQLGFDPGNVTPRKVQLVSLDVNGIPNNITEYTTADSLSSNDRLTLSTSPSPVQAAGDLLIASIIKTTTVLAGIKKNEIYTYKNQLHLANLSSGRIYYSDAVAYLNFTIPGTTTAITAGLLDIDGNFTAMIERKGVLWVSTTDDWYKVTRSIEVNSYGYWTTVEKFEATESTGAKAFAVAIQKGDVIFMAQDKRIRRILTLQIVGTDDIELISDQIEGLLDRLDLDDVRIYYHQRYIFVISANEGVTLMLDTVTREFMPPQYIGMSCMSIIDGIRVGHSNSRNESFYLFSGRNDLYGEIEYVIAGGFYSGDGRSADGFTPKKWSKFGMHARGTITAKCAIEHQYEEFGANLAKPASFKVSDIVTYNIDSDVSFGANPLATHTFAGIDDTPDNSLKGFFIFDRQDMASWFDYRPVFTISGKDTEFHLLAWKIDDEKSEANIPNELFINRE